MNRVLRSKLPPVPRWQRLELRTFVEEVCEALAARLSAQRVVAELDVPFGLSLVADRGMLQEAVRNLITNALDAMPDGGELVVTAVSGPGGIELEVADSGHGLSDDNRRRVFDPFFTTRQDGAGLGLAVVQRVAELHGGSVNAINCPEGGAAFTLQIPRRVLRAAA